MKNFKLLSVFLIAALLAMASFGTARAANNNANNTPTPVTGVVQNLVIETDPDTHVTTVLVTILDENNETQDVRITLDAALTLGLVTLEIVTDQIGLPLTIDPLTVIPNEGEIPPPPDVPITGTIQSLEIQTDTETFITTVLVTLVDENDVATVYRISADTALGLGLVSAAIVSDMIGQTITISVEEMVPEDSTSTNPIDQILGDFLANLLGVDPALITEYHDQGMGFGVIAQAGLLAYGLEGDAAMMQTILDAKSSGDFSTIVLPDGSTPTNWGELRKAVIDQKGSLKNLGNIVSGHADQSADTNTETTNTDSNTNTNNGNSHKPDNANNGSDHPNNGKGKGH